MQVVAKHQLTDFLELFAKVNAGRPTRLGVFERIGEAFQDYWVEDGLPLTGVAVEPVGESTNVELMFGDGGPGSKGHMTRAVRGVGKVKLEVSADGRDDSLELIAENGQRTVLRFENNIFS